MMMMMYDPALSREGGRRYLIAERGFVVTAAEEEEGVQR
jgi:hypothetical protein